MKSPVLMLLPALVLLAACRQEAPEPTPAATPAPEAAAPVAAADPGPPPAGQVPRAFLCRGNEPFWALDISATRALLKTPEAETELLGELAAGETGAFTFRGAPDGSPGEAVGALLAPAQCFDTMADGPAMPFSAQVSFAEGDVATGCCSAEYGLDLAAAPVFEGGDKSDTDWSRLLPELGEAIQRCAFDAGVATDVVTTAWPMDNGKAGVRLRDLGNARFDCVIDLESGAIDNVAPVAEGDTMPGEASPTWRSALGTSPVLTCGRVERVMDVGDVVAGYLHYPEGCD